MSACSAGEAICLTALAFLPVVSGGTFNLTKLITIHGKKAQIAVGGKTQHVVESRTDGSLTYFVNRAGEEYPFLYSEIRDAIFRS
jgi:hypothetical protein